MPQNELVLTDTSRVLIVLMGSLGDLVRGLSLAAAIKKQRRSVYLGWVVDSKWLEVVRLNKFVDQIYVFDRKHPISSGLKLVNQISAGKFDLALDLQRIFKSGIIGFLARIPFRLGFDRSNSKEFNWLLNNRTIGPFSEDESKLRHYSRFLESCGVAVGNFDFGFDLEQIKPKLPPEVKELKRGYCALVLSTSWQTKRWFESEYRSLVSELQRLGLDLVLLGDSRDVELANSICSGVGNSNVVNLVGQTTLTELFAVMLESRLGVGPDCGSAHVASALNRPFVTLFGPTAPSRVAPFGNELLSVSASVSCSPCYLRRCPGFNQICMHQITPAMVVEKVKLALV